MTNLIIILIVPAYLVVGLAWGRHVVKGETSIINIVKGKNFLVRNVLLWPWYMAVLLIILAITVGNIEE